MPEIEYRPERRITRKVSAEVKDRVAVRKALTTIVRRTAFLQKEAAFLRGMSNGIGLSSDQFPRLVALGEDLRAINEAFSMLVAELPPRQREHGRIIDVDRSLLALRSTVAQLGAEYRESRGAADSRFYKVERHARGTLMAQRSTANPT